MRITYAQAVCKDNMHFYIPEDENAICAIEVRLPEAFGGGFAAVTIDRELAVALETLIKSKRKDYDSGGNEMNAIKIYFKDGHETTVLCDHALVSLNGVQIVGGKLDGAFYKSAGGAEFIAEDVEGLE